MQVREARGDEIDGVRVLFREYADWLQEDICLRSFEEELAGLPGAYRPLLIAVEGDELAGCVALRRLDDEIGEMKRLYVRHQFRGRRLGVMLVEELLTKARESGFLRVRLDTLPKMAAAQRMYEAMGFRDIERYNKNASAGVRFMEIDLSARASGGAGGEIHSSG